MSIKDSKLENGDCSQLPVFVNNLIGSLVIHTAHNCSGVRRWYFFYDFGYVIILRLINLTNLNPYVYTFNVYGGNTNKDESLYNSLLMPTNYVELHVNRSSALAELIPVQNNTQNDSFTIEYLFQKFNQRNSATNSFSKQMKATENESVVTNSFYQQPSFIALMSVIGVLFIIFLFIILYLCYRKHQRKKAKYSHHHYSFKEKVKRFIHDKPSRQNDQSHLASLTSSFSSSSIDQKQRNHFSPTNMPYTVQNNNTVLLDPSATTSNLMNNATLPSKRFQQSIMDAYLKDLQSFHPNAHPRQMNSYLFIDLHSTSSETFPDGSGDYEASTTNTEDAIEAAPRTNNQNGKYQKRILSGKKYRKQHRQKRFLNTNNGPRFLMRERQLPVHMLSLPQLRSISNFQNNNTTTSINTINQDSSLTSTEFSSTDDDFDNSHAYHLNQNQMKAIEEEVEDETEHHPTFCSFEHQRTTSTVQSTETNQIQNRFKYFQKRQSVPIQTVPSMTLNANVLLDQSKFSRHTHNHSQNILVQNNNSSEQQQQQQQYFEKVSTSRGDDSDTSFLNDEWKQFKIMQPGDGIAYINDSILV